ncbi:hypothetical protein [Streptomyces sp. NPDC093223]|uniref:hypothetical protein n=1 Tax=Streptomyces sp. NPDC093223 TaxID=3366033 RepID=UPI0038252C32
MIDLGSVYQVAVDVADANGAAVDPGSADLTIILPDGSTVTPAVPTPTTTGQVRVDYVTEQAGRHVWRLVTSSPTTAYADVFDVQPAIPVGIVSLADARAQLNMRPSETADDDELRTFIGAATAAVERALGRAVVRRSITERHQVGRTSQVLLRQVPVLSVTSVTTADGSTSWDPANLRIDSETGLVTVVAGEPLAGDVDFVFEAGEAIIQENHRLAGLIIIQHLWETQRGTMGVQLGGDTDNWSAGRGFAIPRRALELLGSQLPGVA